MFLIVHKIYHLLLLSSPATQDIIDIETGPAIDHYIWFSGSSVPWVSSFIDPR